MATKLYQRLSLLVEAIQNCEKSDNNEWLDKHTERLESLVKNYLPSGSGFDSGTQLSLEQSTPEKLVFLTAFWHMNDNNGFYYDGWTEHKVIVTPRLGHEIDVRVTGCRGRNDIKNYIHEFFFTALTLSS